MGSTPNFGNRKGEVTSHPDFFLCEIKHGSQNAQPTSQSTQVSLLENGLVGEVKQYNSEETPASFLGTS